MRGVSIVVHHLKYSRSIRILWLLEELELPYELKQYDRTPEFRAPASLEAAHPLGRAPVVEVDGKVLVESGAILEYFAEREGKLKPEGDALLEYRFFLHHAEGSVMPPLLVALIMSKLKSSAMPFFVKPIARAIASKLEQAYSDPAVERHIGFLDQTLASRSYFAGDTFSAADIQMLYPVEAAFVRGGGQWPALARWREQVKSRPAYRRAEDRGGPAMPPAGP